MSVTVAALIVIYNTFFLPIKALYTDKHDIIDKQYDIYKVHHIVHLFIDLDCINGIVKVNLDRVLCGASRWSLVACQTSFLTKTDKNMYY